MTLASASNAALTNMKRYDCAVTDQLIRNFRISSIGDVPVSKVGPLFA